MSFLYDSIVQSGNNGSTKNESNLGETLKYGSEPEFESKISHLSNYDIKQYQLEKIVETLSNCEFQPETVKSENSEKKIRNWTWWGSTSKSIDGRRKIQSSLLSK